jgi:hypothetical protein
MQMWVADVGKSEHGHAWALVLKRMFVYPAVFLPNVCCQTHMVGADKA